MSSPLRRSSLTGSDVAGGRASRADEQDAAIVEQIRSALDSLRVPSTEGPLEISVRIDAGLVTVAISASNNRRPPVGDPRTFAEWFGGQLSERSMSQEGAARQLGVSAKTVNRWIRGETEPRYRELLLICDILGESPLPVTANSPAQLPASSD